LGTQSVLWSDAAVFAGHQEDAANAMMLVTTEYAAERAAQTDWDSPLELLDSLLPDVLDFARQVTRTPNLRPTFALNAMVAVDNAAWMLHAREHGYSSFDAMVPEMFQPALSCRHRRLVNIPLVSYNLPVDDVIRAVDQGACLLKIKIGADPDGDGDRAKMLDWDRQRLTDIHRAVGDQGTKLTDCGNVLYYLDANGRYDTPDRLLSLLDHMDKIGALDRILLLEEPFAEGAALDLSNIPVRLAADESAHSDQDALALIQMGYGAIALKPIAKTMSMSLKIARLAHTRQVPCFCADLTANPVLVDWNKNVAARLPALPGMQVGVLESNGNQNYARWADMEAYHPHAGASWIRPADGMFTLDDNFYRSSGGILDVGAHYMEIINCEKGAAL
ncbi:MAG: L-alanine-DL-glutamate epimerase, partial [Lentisphaerae bacterium]|nr:L-alanine-DL-glutamate epimerase [Lentisphaerota bacterium]